MALEGTAEIPCDSKIQLNSGRVADRVSSLIFVCINLLGLIMPGLASGTIPYFLH